MATKKDWFENQIENIGKTMAAILFGKDELKEVSEELKETEQSNSANSIDDIYRTATIDSLINERKFQDAQDYIFKILNNGKTANNLLFAISSYNKILEVKGISEDAAKEKLSEIRNLFKK